MTFDHQKVQLLAMLLFREDEIERYLDLECSNLSFSEVVEKGGLAQRVETRKALYERVKKGEVFAIKEWHWLESKVEFEKRKKKLNECSPKSMESRSKA